MKQLQDGDWGKGGDIGHVTAVRGVALTCQVPLKDFLDKISKYTTMASETKLGVRDKLKKGMRKAQWIVVIKEEVAKFRAIIVSKVVIINLLISIPLA